MTAILRCAAAHSIRWTAILLVASIGLAIAPVVRAADDPDAGFVLEISGTWLLDGKANQKISGGDKLPAGAKFVPQQPGAKSFIVICFYTGKAQTFTKAGEVPQREESSFFSRIAGTIRGNYRSGVVHAISRADGFVDGEVIQDFDGESIDMKAICENLKAGKYLLEWTPLVPEGETPQPIVVTWTWDPDNPEPLISKDLNIWFYELRILDMRTKKPRGDMAFVMVMPRTLRDEDIEYVKAVKLMDQWDEATRTKAGRAFRMACFKSLMAAEKTDDDGAANK